MTTWQVRRAAVMRRLWVAPAVAVVALAAARAWPDVAVNAAALGVARARLFDRACGVSTRSWIETARVSVRAQTAYRLRAECAATERRWADAAADLSEALTGDDPVVLLRRGDARHGLGQRAAALSDWRRAGAGPILLHRGEARARQFDVAGALEWLRLTTDVAPDEGRAYWWLGQEYQYLGRNDEAEAAYRAAARLVPDDMRIQLSLAEFLSGVRHDDTAAGRLLQDVTRRWPARIEPVLAAGRMASRQGRYDAAEALYAQAERLDPASPEPGQWHGLDLLAQGRASEAVSQFQRAVALSGGTNAFAYYNLAFSLAATGQVDAATANFEKAIELRPRYVPFALGAGRHYEATGRPCDALRHYRAAAAADPTDPRLKEATEALTRVATCR